MFAAADSISPKTIEQRLVEFREIVRGRMLPAFESAGVPYPPAAMTMIALKRERRLELYAAGADGVFRFIRVYPILAASGSPGPKLREGDRQVPEGSYNVQSLNPNSRFHLGLRLDYPNDFDRERAAADGRTSLGGDIMIHGAAASKGCLAMGDPAAEDLFVLVALVGVGNVQVIIAPSDFRSVAPSAAANAPAWTADLYAQIARELVHYRKPEL